MRHNTNTICIGTWSIKTLDSTEATELVLSPMGVESVSSKSILALFQLEISCWNNEVMILLHGANAATGGRENPVIFDISMPVHSNQ